MPQEANPGPPLPLHLVHTAPSREVPECAPARPARFLPPPLAVQLSCSTRLQQETTLSECLWAQYARRWNPTSFQENLDFIFRTFRKGLMLGWGFRKYQLCRVMIHENSSDIVTYLKAVLMSDRKGTLENISSSGSQAWLYVTTPWTIFKICHLLWPYTRDSDLNVLESGSRHQYFLNPRQSLQPCPISSDLGS